MNLLGCEQGANFPNVQYVEEQFGKKDLCPRVHFLLTMVSEQSSCLL